MINFTDWMTLSQLSGDFTADYHSINCTNTKQISVAIWKKTIVMVDIPVDKTAKTVS